MENITIKNLSFTYPNQASEAITHINLTINAGEFLVLCGISGCGKSTLLRQLKPILALHGSREGQVLIGGRDVTSFSQKEQAQRIGFVMQNPDNQIVCDKVWHELAFGLENLGCPPGEIRARVAEMATFFGISTWYEKNVTELSGGQKQLLNLAAVMVMQPDILILDEPTAQLDPIAAHDFLETVSKINKELGTTVLLSEHRLEEALPLSDKVIVLEQGKVIAEGTLPQVGAQLAEQKSPMLSAFPTPMRVYFAQPDAKPCPVNVREGRLWLSDKTLQKKDYPQTEKAKGKPLLSSEGLWVRYEQASPDVLRNVSQRLHEGECYALLGGNGTGKSTLLSVLMGTKKPYRGKVKVAEGKKIATLPQNPQCLFLTKSVSLELWNMVTKEDAEKVQSVVDFCELGNLLDRHPYDLSGGEQQRLALAKILLTEPDILLLDEPTKGLDAHFKQKLARLLNRLKQQGIAILMVSHDVEFCAEYADRLGLFFDGHIVSEDEPRRFFAGKNFYTTAASRMARQYLPEAVLTRDITEALGAEPAPEAEVPKDINTPPKVTAPMPTEKSKPKKVNLLLGIFFAVAFLLTQCSVNTNDFSIKSNLTQGLAILLAGLSLYQFVPKRALRTAQIVSDSPQKLPKRTIIASLIVLLLIPLTLIWGMTALSDRKYYLISLLIILEIFLPFFFTFEGRKPQARELIIISVFCALSVAGRLAFAPLPQFKPVLAMVIISGLAFGSETGFLVGAVTAFVSNFYFTQGPWTPWQMFAFGIVGFLAGIVFRKNIFPKNRIALSLYGFASTILIFGGITNPISVILYYEEVTWELILASYAGGFIPDLVHGASTAFFLWFFAEPLWEKLEHIKTKYGL